MKAQPLNTAVLKPLIVTWAAALLWLSGCGGAGAGSDWQPAETADTFQVEMPAYLHRTNELHDFAGLQYANDRRGVYVIGIQESQTKMSGIQLQYTLADYSDFVVSNVQAGLDTANVISVDTGQVNGLAARITSLSGAVYGDERPLNVYYRIGVYESLGYYYQLICWTSQQQQVRYEPDMDRILRSVRAGNGGAVTAQK